jgi:hypothetical protein
MTASPAHRPPAPGALAVALVRVAQLLLLIALAALVPALFPFQPLAAAWSLRIAQILVEMAPVVLLALLCCLMAQHIQAPTGRRLAARIAGIGYGLYLALVPLQLLSYGAIWFATGSETQQRLQVLQTQLLAVQPRVQAADSTAELQQIIALPAARPSSLTEQKQQVLQAIEGEVQKQRVQLERQRDQFLLTSLAATLRGALVAAAMAVGLRFVIRLAIC